MRRLDIACASLVHTPSLAMLNRFNWMTDPQRSYRRSLYQRRYCIPSRGMPEGETFHVAKLPRNVGRQGASTLSCNRVVIDSPSFSTSYRSFHFLPLSLLHCCIEDLNPGHLDTIPTICRIRYFVHSLLSHLIYDTRKSLRQVQGLL